MSEKIKSFASLSHLSVNKLIRSRQLQIFWELQVARRKAVGVRGGGAVRH